MYQFASWTKGNFQSPSYLTKSCWEPCLVEIKCIPIARDECQSEYNTTLRFNWSKCNATSATLLWSSLCKMSCRSHGQRGFFVGGVSGFKRSLFGAKVVQHFPNGGVNQKHSGGWTEGPCLVCRTEGGGRAFQGSLMGWRLDTIPSLSHSLLLVKDAAGVWSNLPLGALLSQVSPMNSYNIIHNLAYT